MHNFHYRWKKFVWFLAGCLFVVVMNPLIHWAKKETLADWRDIATIAGIAIALFAYLTNSYFQFRNKKIENLTRYFGAHEKLFEDGSFILSHIKELEAGTYKRDPNDENAEKQFNRLLGRVEEIAYLTSHAAVDRTIQIYTFGWFAQRIQPHLTNRERNNVFWELAIHYIDELKKAADDYENLPQRKRDRYLKKHNLKYA